MRLSPQSRVHMGRETCAIVSLLGRGTYHLHSRPVRSLIAGLTVLSALRPKEPERGQTGAGAQPATGAES